MKKDTPAIKANTHLQKVLQNTLNKPRSVYTKYRYNTPLFIAHEMFGAFRQHNVLGLSAALSFYAMFALIPLVLLVFFLLSHLVFSSDYAIVKLAIITANLVPQLSSTIMLEVYNTAQHKAAWGAAGLFVLLWAVTPLAGAMRSAFYNIAALVETPSFVRSKIKDVFAIIGMLLLFFLFTFAGLLLEEVIAFLGVNDSLSQFNIVSIVVSRLLSLVLTTSLIAVFYLVFFPVRLQIKHILAGSLFTAILWLLMRPVFGVFLSVNESYNSIFGSMQGLFVSITWLYFNFAVFLLGTELIATLRKKDVLLLKNLFDDKSLRKSDYIQKILRHYGKTYRQNDYVFKHGDSTHNLYYMANGQVKLMQNDRELRTIESGDYFGEMALLSNTPTIADAIVSSEQADIVVISPEHIETLILDEPKVAMKFLRQMAIRLQMRND